MCRSTVVHKFASVHLHVFYQQLIVTTALSGFDSGKTPGMDDRDRHWYITMRLCYNRQTDRQTDRQPAVECTVW